MPFEYYCTNCGRKLSQDTVLFDMQYILTKQESNKFSILKFRLTLPALTALYNAGTPQEDNFRACQLTLSELMAFISDRNNLNDSAVAGLTMADIDAYLKEDSLSSAMGRMENQAPGGNDPFAAKTAQSAFPPIFDTAEPAPAPEPAPTEQLTTAEPEKSAAIIALEQKDTANKDKVRTKTVLQEDLKILKSMFGGANEVCRFQIRLQTERDNNNAEVVTSYVVYPALFIREARVCGKCGYPVFDHAGTAKHKCVAFFGTQRSGKTSLLIALTHYAQNGMLANFSSDIWKNARQISSVRTIDLLNRKPSEKEIGSDAVRKYRNTMLYRDLEKYMNGIAPPKTDPNQGKSAYSATFRIQDTKGRFHLLTLTDLPGELIDETNGEVNKQNLIGEFPTALACEAYVICFDTCPDGNEQSRINATLRAADTIQEMHATKWNRKSHIPVIIVYTKNSELEQQKLPPEPHEGNPRGEAIKKAHTFYGECARISSNRAYDFVAQQFNNYLNLKDAYKTRLRCSAFGYTAPSQEDLDKDPTIPTQEPTPKYVDYLMRWILGVCGCIPVEGGYQALFGGPVWQVEENYLARPQYRKDKPSSMEESLARCILFENPGELDTAYVRAHGNRSELIALKFWASFRQNHHD